MAAGRGAARTDLAQLRFSSSVELLLHDPESDLALNRSLVSTHRAMVARAG
jgi:hypothetical protein